jgi:hypothetical protein
MFQIHDNSTIYILAPAYTKGGGQEALHQLCYYLRKKGLPAIIAYYAYTNRSAGPVAAEYLKYGTEFCFINDIQDEPYNLIVCPEVQTGMLADFTKAQKAIWWLGIGCYRSDVRRNSLVRLAGAILGLDLSRARRILYERRRIFRFSNEAIRHLTASHYAYEFVKRHLAGKVALFIEPLGLDFINAVLRDEKPDLTGATRKNRILFNPNRKSGTMRLLMKKYPGFEYVPLRGMSSAELIKTMKTSKVYVDFGKFPGAERLPKEAAACGCCILTGRRGAAAFYGDVRIGDEFKICRQPRMLEKIKEKLDLLLGDYDNQVGKFAEYRKMIEELEPGFNCQIEAIFQRSSATNP